MAHATGALGVGDLNQRNAPTRVMGALRFKEVSGGTNTTCGLDTDDRLYCWGDNTVGQAAQPLPLSPRPVSSSVVFRVP